MFGESLRATLAQCLSANASAAMNVSVFNGTDTAKGKMVVFIEGGGFAPATRRSAATVVQAGAFEWQRADVEGN